MCWSEETKILGVCSCLCTEVTQRERAMIEFFLATLYQKPMLLQQPHPQRRIKGTFELTGRDIFVLCEFFARRGPELWAKWGMCWRERPQAGCLLLKDCLAKFHITDADAAADADAENDADAPFLLKWIKVYLHEFFEPRESLPELGETFEVEGRSLRTLLDFCMHHGGCLTNKFIFVS
jgi:hypothetical protein